MPISRPAVSQHLKLLREAGIVRDEPQGRQRVYRRQLDQFWSDALGNLATRSEQERGIA